MNTLGFCGETVAVRSLAALMFHSRLRYRGSMMRRILARAVESTIPPLCVLGLEAIEADADPGST
mgnify:CR=1 FL=1